MARVLITGGCGFIASFLVAYILQTTDWEIVLLSKSESHHGNVRLRDIGALENPRVQLIRCDMSSGIPPVPDVDYILHMGAESHVDTSISEPEAFIRSNVIGTFRMLEYARTLPNLKKFLYFSTDEVFGPAQPGESFNEWSRYNSCNPYAATKAAAEELCLAWENTYKVPVVITHCMNVFGERQHPEKFVPLIVKKLLKDEPITIHLDAAGSPVHRRFVYGGDVARAVMLVLEHGINRQKYNIAGKMDKPLSQLVQVAGSLLNHEPHVQYGKPTIRPGVDSVYSVGGTNLSDLGWKPSPDSAAEFVKTVQWYQDHEKEWYV